MDQSGSGVAHPHIIDRGDLKSRRRLFLEALITLAFWSGFVYLLIPVVTLILWMTGFWIGYAEIIGNKGLEVFVDILRRTGVIILCVTLLIIGWGYYNYLWFRVRGERRNSRTSICYEEDFCRLYHIDQALLQRAKSHPSVRVCYLGGTCEVALDAEAWASAGPATREFLPCAGTCEVTVIEPPKDSSSLEKLPV